VYLIFSTTPFLRAHLCLDGQSLMRAAMSQLNLSARTIADLGGCEEIQYVHLAEALQ
jgi:predicted ATPase with chaperone activity